MTIRALIFDVFGTCVDWRTGVAREVANTFAGKGHNIDAAAFADAWRAEYQPSMEPVRSGARDYVQLDDLHLENLNRVLVAWGLGDVFSHHELQDLNPAWEKLPPWPDVVPGLTRLKERFLIAPNSNGSIALMTKMAKYGGLPWDCILGADVTKVYKPDPLAYRLSAAALRLAKDEVMMVAAHNDDLEAARAEGLKTAFVPRPTEHGPGQTRNLSPSEDWDVVADNFEDLATRLEA